jgi:acyl-CoA reductase-like NAD-dependent aldehyde dehydrogenase
VALFFRVANEDEAVALANDSKYGLGSSVFTANIARGKQVASRIDTGMAFVNHPPGQRQNYPLVALRTPATDASSQTWSSRNSLTRSRFAWFR